MYWDKDLGWVDQPEESPFSKGLEPGDTCPVVEWTKTNPPKYQACECGSEVVYGKDTNLHSNWCPKYKK